MFQSEPLRDSSLYRQLMVFTTSLAMLSGDFAFWPAKQREVAVVDNRRMVLHVGLRKPTKNFSHSYFTEWTKVSMGMWSPPSDVDSELCPKTRISRT
jgi:hypothetical protein